jgi:hypothetical protein
MALRAIAAVCAAGGGCCAGGERAKEAGRRATAMEAEVMRLYEGAIRALSSADDQAGAEVQAEDFLSRAITMLSGAVGGGAAKGRRWGGAAGRGSKQQAAGGSAESAGLLAELQLLLGRVVEWREPERALAAYSAAHALTPGSPDANHQLARLRWKCASTSAHIQEVESRLRDARRLVRVVHGCETEGGGRVGARCHVQCVCVCVLVLGMPACRVLCSLG